MPYKKQKNKELVYLIRNEVKEMSKNEKPDIMVNIVEKILEFIRQNQEGQGLKILTPEQMFCRLPISLAQLEAENNSEKLKNEKRQLLYSLCRSKKLRKTTYKHLMNTII